MDGIEMLTQMREQIPDQIIIVVTAYASLDTSIKALRAGAYDYIMKPIIHEEIKQIVRNALRQKSLQSENVLLKREIGKDHDFSSIIGESAALQDHPRRGPEGHGHQEQRAAPRRDRHRQGALSRGSSTTTAPAATCPSSRSTAPPSPRTLLETELFGHVRGAFTGAVATKKGHPRRGRGRHRVPRRDRRHEPVPPGKTAPGDRRPGDPAGGQHQGHKVDIRFITATNKDLNAAVRAGRLPRGPVLPDQRDLPADPAPSGKNGGHRCALPSLPRPLLHAK